MKYIVSVPRLSGLSELFDSLEDATARMSELAGSVTRESGDGSTTYFYDSDKVADSDRDGAYTPQIRRVEQ